MNRKEILEQAKNEGYDEFLQASENRAMTYGFVASSFVSLVFMIIAFFKGFPIYPFIGISFSCLAFSGFYKYRLNKSFIVLIQTICSFIVVLFSIYMVIEL